MNLVDSSGWLEYLADGPNAAFFAPALEATADLLVSAINLYEVFKRVLQQRGKEEAMHAVALMQQATVLDVTAPIALSAAQLSVESGLPMADSLILSTAWTRQATLWTQDEHFKNIRGAKFIEKK